MDSAARFERAVERLFARLGTRIFVNDFLQAPFSIQAIVRQPEEWLELGEARVHAEIARVDVMSRTWSNPEKGNEMTIKNRLYTIVEEPRLDQHQLVWTFDVLPN